MAAFYAMECKFFNSRGQRFSGEEASHLPA